MTFWGIMEMDRRVRWDLMDGVVLVYEYCDEDDIERSKIIYGWKQGYPRQYYLVSEWYTINAV